MRNRNLRSALARSKDFPFMDIVRDSGTCQIVFGQSFDGFDRIYPDDLEIIEIFR